MQKTQIGTARLLADHLKEVPGVEIARPVAANAVFAVLSREVQARLQKAGWRYYQFIGGAARLMTSWHTSDQDVMALLPAQEAIKIANVSKTADASAAAQVWSRGMC